MNYFHFRSALKDSEEALKLKPEYDKALIRAANCCFEMKLYKKCVEFCDQVLDKNKTNTIILELRKKSINEQKLKERNERKRELEEKKKMKDEENLISEILRRGYQLENDSTSKFRV